MKLENLLGGSLKDLGLRFHLIGILPTTVLLLFILALLWSGAPANSPNLALVAQHARGLETKEASFLILAVLAVALVAQPLQLSLVRLLEGYWGGSRLGAGLSRLGIAVQRRRRRRLAAGVPQTMPAAPPPPELARIAMTAWRLRQFFPAEDRLLPTTLGNVLRAAEDHAGKRYGLDAVVAWPRLYPFLPDKLVTILSDQRDQLDLAVRFCAVFLLAALISAGVLIHHGWWLLVPAAALALAWLAYQSAVAAALAYGEGIQTAFDLHRFDMLKGLHLPLPADRIAEREANRELCDFLRQGIPANFQYLHAPPKDAAEKR